jgi:hypothetical protein
MRTRKIIPILLFLSLGFFLFNSCQKEAGNPFSEDDLNMVEDDALAEAIFSDVMESVNTATNMIDDMLYGSGSLKSMTTGCPTISVDKPDTENWPKIITIDWGEGCEGFYGQTRSGMIKITITGRYRTPGTSRTIEFFDYYFNGIHVEGTKTVTNNGRNENENLTFTATLEGGRITIPAKDDGSDDIVLTKSFTKTREWAEGENTFNPFDDVYFITGSATGTNFKGMTYNRTIQVPLEWSASCRFIKSGSILLEMTDREPILLDYGNGECDNEATITRNGETKTILLRHKHRWQLP